MRKLDFIVLVSIVAGIVLVAGLVLGLFFPISKSSVSQQSGSHEIQYLRNEILLESAKTLDRMDKRLKRMEQDIIKIRERLTESI